MSALTVIQIQCQDKNFCDINNIVPKPDPKLPPVIDFGKYQARVERNKQSVNASEDITEYFDGDDNAAVAISRLGNFAVRTYSYYNTNELLTISDDGSNKCGVYRLNESYGLTPFYLITDKDGRERILSPLQYLVGMQSFVLVNINDTVIRGINANNWQTCAYSSATKQTLKITISFVDQDKWNDESSPFLNSKPVPLMVQIDSRTDQGKVDFETYAITQFRPYITSGDEEFFTPSGVYCQDRKNTKSVPEVPKRFEFQAEIVTPFFMDLVGFINETREQYDYEEKLFRQDFSVYNSLVTEIHDFNTGLKFRIDENSGNCSIDVIDGNGVDAETDANGLVKIRDPSTFFDFDSNNFQYTGRKVKNGMETNVWIGKKNISGLDGTFEWYFLTDKWIDADSGKKFPVPISCIITVNVPNPQNPNQPNIITNMYTFTSFQSSKTLLLNHDLTKCGKGIAKGYFLFRIATDADRTLIREKWITFNNDILKKIQTQSKITMIRITNLQIDMKNDTKEDIIISFEMFDKIGRYGNVEPPEFDVGLTEAINNLKSSIDSNAFTISLTLNGTRKLISAKQNTLQKLVSPSEAGGVSKGATAGIAVAVALLGLIVSVVLLILHKNNTITLPFI